MPPQSAAIQPPLRRTLLEWIESDDGNASSISLPITSAQLATLHARIVVAPDDGGDLREPIQPPPGLRIAPLG